jgi:hypothetical protein
VAGPVDGSARRGRRRRRPLRALARALGPGLLLLAGLGAASPARAQDPLEFGVFRLVPRLQVSGEYNDNVVLAPSDKADDFIWTIGVELGLKARTDIYGGNLSYRADILRYTELTQFDTTRHTAHLDLRAEPGDRLRLSLTEEFRRTDDFVGEPVPELTELSTRHENTLEADVEYRVAERWSAGLGYRFFLIDYLEDDLSDLSYKDHTVHLTLFYLIVPRLDVLARYDYQITRYDEDEAARTRDSDSHFGWVGLRGELTDITTAQIRAGGSYKDFADGTSSTDLVVAADVVWKYREPSQLRLFVNRTVPESTFTTDNVTDKYYVATYGGVEVTHVFTPQIAVRATGLIGTNEYPDETTLDGQTDARFDWVYSLALALRYDFRRWLAFELGYTLRVRDSNFSDFDYTQNRVKLAVTATW